MAEEKYIKALELMIDEFDYPSRDLRLGAQVFDCLNEVETICSWLKLECEKEIRLRKMFDEQPSES